MKSKILMKLSTIAMVCLVGIGFIGNTVSMSASVVNRSALDDTAIYNETLINGENNEIQPRFISMATVAALLAGMGLGWLGDAIYTMGGYKACSIWNDSNWVMDWYCDANGWYAD